VSDGYGTWAPGPRDALVTGMGFCLPGSGDEPVREAKDVWATAAAGASHVERDGFHHGTVRGAREVFGELLPEVPARYLRSYADVHLYGLISLAEACGDAGLDHRASRPRCSAPPAPTTR
jgi:3-oxoacyl-[acyl-carrier-protein] synthase II